MKCNHTSSFLAAGSFTISLLLHGVPQTLAFAQKPTPRFPRPRYATTVVNQSSRSVFSPSELYLKDEKLFQAVTEMQSQRPRQETSKVDKNSPRTLHDNSSVTLNNIKLLQNPALSGLDRDTVMLVTATSLLVVLAFCTFFQGGWLPSFFRRTTWWFQFAFNSYRSILINNPLSTKVCTGAILAVLGDALAQFLTNGGAPYDKRRAASFAMFDSCYRVFQHYIFPKVIAFCQGNLLKQLGIAPFIGAAVERTMVYQLVVVPVRG
jgi:hypothetical protein